MEEALAILHKWLDITGHRDLIPSREVTDLLLDIQQALTREPELLIEAPVLETV